jgi:exopolyphosphatase / guanosine-5'-triphosphate,3'-diphosphate pyrophosphatase
LYAALDLGTNNCRLLAVEPEGKGYKVADTYSRSVRLGEGLWVSGFISEEVQARTLVTLKECANRLNAYPIIKFRAVATEACRAAANGAEFIARIERETGLKLKIISQQEEIRLATAACIPLLDKGYDRAAVFDIGGGSTEIAWVNLRSGVYRKGGFWDPEIISWHSAPYGVVKLSDEFKAVSDEAGRQKLYDDIVEKAYEAVREFYQKVKAEDTQPWKSFHLLGASGTVTTLAALTLGLKRYNRFAVDGSWLSGETAELLIENIRKSGNYRVLAEGFTGLERSDLLLPGCAVLQAVLKFFPKIRLRVADRGVREGIIADLVKNSFNGGKPAKKK